MAGPSQIDLRQSSLRSALAMVGSAANATADTLFPLIDAQIAKLFEDRNVLLTDGGTISFSGTQVTFSDTLNIVINQKISGAVPQIISLGSATQNLSANGAMLIAVVNRTAGTATVSVVAAGGSLPAVNATNQEVYLIAKRVDASGGVSRLYFRSGLALSKGQSSRLGAVGTVYAQEFAIADITDSTKQVIAQVSGAATSTKTTLVFSQTVNRTLDFPDATDTLVARNTVDALTNKTFGDAITLNEIVTPANPSAGSVKIYSKSDDSIYALNSSGVETLLGGGGSPSGLQYVEFVNKDPVNIRVASTVNLTTVNTTGIGANTGNTLNGVVLALNDLILLKNQTTASENGIYKVKTGSSPLVRDTSADTIAELNGYCAFVINGTSSPLTMYYQTATLTSMSDPQTWSSSAQTFSWTCPADVTQVQIFACGGGGAGGSGGGASSGGAGSTAGGGGSGGGGANPTAVWQTVVPATVYTITLGIGGKPGSVTGSGAQGVKGGNGGNTTFDSLLTFHGASGGGASSIDVTIPGISGGNPNSTGTYADGGSGAIGSASSGNSGWSSFYASGGAGGVTGSGCPGGSGGGAGLVAGAPGAVGSANNANANSAVDTITNKGAGGGGGGGAANSAAPATGGRGSRGGDGYLKIVW